MHIHRKLRRMMQAGLAMMLVSASVTFANASGWVVQPAASEILFEYTSDGTPKTGVFGSFDGTGEFDKQNPSNATLELRIETSSIDLGDILASSFAQSAEWFDSKNHPDVIYRLISLTPLDGNRYEAKGRLTIRGEEQPITSQIDLEIGDDSAVAKGSLVIVRADYLLGVGPSAAFVEVGPNVTVSFDLKAVRAE